MNPATASTRLVWYGSVSCADARQRSGRSVLVSSQHLDEVARMADRILLLHHGQILGGLDPHALTWSTSSFSDSRGRPGRAEAAMNAALEFELLKARRAGVFRWGAVVVAVGVPALSTAFFELVRLGGDSPSAAKAATMITDLSLAGLLGTAGQVLSVAILMTAGIAAVMEFRPEFVDDALPVLFAIATPRSSVAAAKFVVLAGWALLTVVSTVILTVVGGLLVELDMNGRPSRRRLGSPLPVWGRRWLHRWRWSRAGAAVTCQLASNRSAS